MVCFYTTGEKTTNAGRVRGLAFWCVFSLVVKLRNRHTVLARWGANAELAGTLLQIATEFERDISLAARAFLYGCNRRVASSTWLFRS